MKKTLIAGAALAALAGFAQAQSVTIFGIVDAGVEYQSKVGTAADNDSRTSMQNGGIAPSIWGFRGSEDLGGGLKAVFNLEGDFNSDTGGPRFDGGLMLFGRQANVGLSGDFGTVLLGRQYSPALLAELGTDPRGYRESFSSLLPYALSQAPTGNTGLPALDTSRNNFVGIFNGNALSYTNSFGPVTVRAAYGLGEVAGKTSDASTVALGVTYVGPITVSGSYQQIKGGAGTDAETERFGVGVAVPFGDFTFKALYAASKADDIAGDKVSDADYFGVGVNWNWNPQNTLIVAYYQGKDKEGTSVTTLLPHSGKTKDLVLSNDYALSKRTTLYAQLVYSDIDDNANTALSIAADRGPVAGEKTTIFGMGIKHSF
ncbi:MAG TPA: porin [Methylibium sp.]|nr:porin [Methylibium sp.]